MITENKLQAIINELKSDEFRLQSQFKQANADLLDKNMKLARQIQDTNLYLSHQRLLISQLAKESHLQQLSLLSDMAVLKNLIEHPSPHMETVQLSFGQHK